VNWNYQMTQITMVIEDYLKTSVINLKSSSVKFYILYWTNCPDIAHLGAASQFRAITLRGHIQVAHTLNKHPMHCQISTLTNVAGYISETHLSH